MRPTAVQLAMVSACLVLSACGGPASQTDGAAAEAASPERHAPGDVDHGPSSPPVDAPPAHEGDSSSAPAVITPTPPAGLMTRSGKPPGAPTETFVTSAVVMLNWSDIQPTNATDPPDWSTLDTQLSTLSKVGVKEVRLRIMSGGDAPAWVKRLGAPAPGYFNGVTTTIDCSPSGQGETKYGGIAVQNIQHQTACVPFFWTSAYLDQYRSLMQLLDTRLTSDPSKYDVVSTIVEARDFIVQRSVGAIDGNDRFSLFGARSFS